MGGGSEPARVAHEMFLKFEVHASRIMQTQSMSPRVTTRIVQACSHPYFAISTSFEQRPTNAHNKLTKIPRNTHCVPYSKRRKLNFSVLLSERLNLTSAVSVSRLYIVATVTSFRSYVYAVSYWVTRCFASHHTEMWISHHRSCVHAVSVSYSLFGFLPCTEVQRSIAVSADCTE